MWVRLRFDATWMSWLFAVVGCVLPRLTRHHLARLHDAYDDAMLCLSVRSAFDLWLSSQNFPAGSEILFSAITIPQMPEIARKHGLVPVPIDLAAGGITPSLDALRRAVTPQSRAIVVAHLFGTRIDMEPILRIAQAHDLRVVEDLAQAFDGTLAAHPQTDVALFSFGPIKTATAFGGFRCKSPRIIGPR